jgi:hypothetical protein
MCVNALQAYVDGTAYVNEDDVEAFLGIPD